MKTIPSALLLILSLAVASAPAQQAADEHFGQPLAFWLDRLQSKDVLERDEAVQVLTRVGTAGRAAAPLLKPLLKDARPETRFQAALALWNVQDDGADSVPTLSEDFARLPQPRKQQLLQFALARKKLEAPLFALFAVLRREPPFEITIASHLPTLGKAAIPYYVKWIDDRQGEERAAVIRATPFAFLVASKGEMLARYLKDPDPFCRVAAAAALVNVPETRDDALAVLVELSGSKDEAVVDAVLRGLIDQRLTFRKAAAVYPLGLKHPSLEVRLGVVRPVLLLRPDRIDELLPILEEAVQDRSPLVRYRAYPLITELGKRGEKLVPVLMAKLKAPEAAGEVPSVLAALAPHAERVAKEVGELLFADPRLAGRVPIGSLRAFAPHFADQLKKHLAGDDAARQKLAARLARELPPAEGKALVPLLTPLLKKDDTAPLVLEVLEWYGREARAAAGEVFALLEGPGGGRLLPAVGRALVALEPEPKALGALLDAFKRKAAPTPEERLLAAELSLLHRERRAEAYDLLGPLLGDPNLRLPSLELTRTLEKVGPEDAKLVPALRARLKARPGSLLDLDRVFIRMGPAAREVVPDLLEQIEKERDYSMVLRAALVIYVLDPGRRGAADERAASLFLDRLERLPHGDELNFHFRQVADLCQTKVGPTKALAPLLKTIFRKYPRLEVQADLAPRLVQLDPAAEAEVVKAFEDNLGEFPSHSQPALVGLLRLRPDHPAALAAVKRYLEGATPLYPAAAARVAMQCDRPLPGVRELLEEHLKASKDPAFRFPAYVALMRHDGKLNPVWVEEIFAGSSTPATLADLRWLGPLARPLIPRLRALPGDPFQKYGYDQVAAQIERAQ